MLYISIYRFRLRRRVTQMLLGLTLSLLIVSCTAGDKGSEKVPDSVAIDTSVNQNPTAVGESGESIPADTAAAGNEPKTESN